MNFNLKLLFLVFFILLSVTTLSAEETDATLFLQNELIKIVVNKGPFDLGRFAIETTSGDPKNILDDNQSLIYGRPLPWTSYTTIRIDNVDYIFGGATKKSSKRSGTTLNYGIVTTLSVTDEGIYTECLFGKVRIGQQLSFFRNPATRVYDTVKVKYNVINEDNLHHEIGIRIMMDTKLGSNDGAPFRIGNSAANSEILISKNALFDYFQTFDSLTTPNVIAQGTLSDIESSVYPPDQILLANWGTLSDQPWMPEYEEGRSFIRQGEFEKDTALALYWMPQYLIPNNSFSVSTLYGLAGLTLSPGELSLGLTAPAEVYQSSKNKFLIMAYVYNSGGFDSKNTIVTLDAPRGFIFSGSKNKWDIGDLKSGETYQIPINVTLNNPSEGINNLKLLVSSESLESNEIERHINVLAPPSIQSQLRLDNEVSIDNITYLDAELILANKTLYPITNINARLKINSPLELPIYDLRTKSIPVLHPGQIETLHWKIKANTKKSQFSPISVVIDSSATEAKTITEKIKLVTPLAKIVLEASDLPTVTEPYFYINLNILAANNINEENLEIAFDSDVINLVRVSPVYNITNPDTPITYTKNKKSVFLMTNKIKNSLKTSTIAKLHFKAVTKGKTVVVLRRNGIIIDSIELSLLGG